jgi:hypothetical protein
MKKINTIHGNVTVTDVAMNRASGYGQYTISINVIFEGNKKTIYVHSTDSQMFDELTDLENNSDRSEYLMTNAKYTIETEIQEFISSL